MCATQESAAAHVALIVSHNNQRLNMFSSKAEVFAFAFVLSFFKSNQMLRTSLTV